MGVLGCLLFFFLVLHFLPTSRTIRVDSLCWVSGPAWLNGRKYPGMLLAWRFCFSCSIKPRARESQPRSWEGTKRQPCAVAPWNDPGHWSEMDQPHHSAALWPGTSDFLSLNFLILFSFVKQRYKYLPCRLLGKINETYVSLIFRNWELILLIWSQLPWEKKADLPESCVEIQLILFVTLGLFCMPHAAFAEWKTTHRRRRGWWENLPVFWSSPKGTHKWHDLCVTSLPCRVSNPARGPLPHQWWGIKEPRGKSQTEESAWKRCFYVHLSHGKKRTKVYSMKIYVSQKIYPHEPVCSNGVIIQELPNGSHKIRVGVGKRATKGKEVIMWYFFSSFRSLGT